MAVSKPLPGQQIDRTAPAAQNILAAYAFNEGGGLRINDSVGVRPSASGSATALTWSGRGGVFNGASTVVDVSRANPGLLKTSKFSGLVKFNTTAAGQVALMTAWRIGVSPGWEFSINTSHQLYFIFSDAAGSNYFIVATTATFNDGKDHVAEFTYGGSNAGAGVSIYVDGAKQALSISTAGTADPGTVTDFSILIGRRNSAGQPNWYAGSIGALALWSAKIDAGFAQAITANPWQLWPDDQIVFAPAAGTTGTSSATVTLTGSATGAVAVAGASSQTLPLTGTSTGAVSVAGASAGTVNLTGTATGAAAVAGASSATVSLTGSATGTSAIAGASSGTVDLAGTATGTIPPLAVSGASAGTFDLSGTSTASVAVAGASAGTVALTGTAAGTAPVAGASSSTLALTGSAAGTVAVAGASSVTIALTGSATGLVQNFSAVSNGTFTLAGTATGSVDVAGASAAQIDIGGAAAFTIRTILGSSAGRVQTSASRTEALNSADRQNTYNPERIAAGSGKRGSNTQTQRR